MKRLVDVVNFNADASCLSSGRWLASLQGGASSEFSRWLGLYVKRNRKIVLGLTGASVADIATFNPEAIDLINRHPEIFEIILRPFAHDVGLLRSSGGFATNLDYGRRTLGKEFGSVAPYFLPPEFMLTSRQVLQLSEAGVAGVFINPGRFSEEIRHRIPEQPYRVAGVLGSLLDCIPFHGALTESYLRSLHRFEGGPWNACLASDSGDPQFSWRDGESAFLMPRGQEREEAWIGQETSSVERIHLADLSLSFVSGDLLGEHHYRSYPVHSFSAWMKEFRMLGFVHRLQEIEAALDRLGTRQQHLWLLAINSDILSAIEKKSPTILLREDPSSEEESPCTLLRSERGFEGEEYLSLLERSLSTGCFPDIPSSSRAPHILKLRARLEFLERLDAFSGTGSA